MFQNLVFKKAYSSRSLTEEESIQHFKEQGDTVYATNSFTHPLLGKVTEYSMYTFTINDIN